MESARDMRAIPLRIVINALRLLSQQVARLKGIRRKGIHYIVEGRDWSITMDGEAILGNLREILPDIPLNITRTTIGLYHQIIHFGSIWSFIRNLSRTHVSNRIVVTFFHGHGGMGPEMEKAIATLLANLQKVSYVVTTSRMMERRLLEWGVPKEKVHRIPLGVDLECFSPPSLEERLRMRRRLEIPDDVICIGSFQKDGIGWDEGLEPKYIKGPDLLVESLKRLNRNFPIFVVLTGPARGYVKKNLNFLGIPYIHNCVSDYHELPNYYHCLDLYLITSREEGGPKALLECMATGVPLVSTRVGMAPDVIQNGVNGLLVDVEDIEGIVQAARRLIEDAALRRRIISNGYEAVKAYSWKEIVKAYHQEIYGPLLAT